MLYYEYCKKTNERNGTFIKETELEGKVGYRSVYGFKDKPSSSSGLKEHLPSARELIIDLDDGEESYKELMAMLQFKNISYSLFSSGGKGYHIEIPMKEISSFDLPYSQKCWVEELGIPFDKSIYRNSSLIRLSGTIHEKTGRKKELIEFYQGKTLELPLKERPPLVEKIAVSDDKFIPAVLYRISQLSSWEPSLGNRFNALWLLAKDLTDLGCDKEYCIQTITLINNTWKNKKTKEELTECVRQARRHLKA